jgi:hypothetical protein
MRARWIAQSNSLELDNKSQGGTPSRLSTWPEQTGE